MIDVLGVHGIGQQQGGRHQMLPAWRAALADGVERARGRHGSSPTLDLAFYGDLFLADDGTKGLPDAVSSYDDVAALGDDMLGFLTDVGEEVGGEVDEKQPPDKGFRRLPPRLANLAAALEERFGLAGALLFIGDLVQVRRFQRDGALADDVLARVREGLEGNPRVLIGHSLGSVVAHEALCRLPDHGVQTLVTLGSPLGLRSIRESLGPRARERTGLLPPGVVTWVNVFDLGDPVALAGGLQPHWPGVVDVTVENGDDPHAVARYLGKKQVGEQIARALS